MEKTPLDQISLGGMLRFPRAAGNERNIYSIMPGSHYEQNIPFTLYTKILFLSSQAHMQAISITTDAVKAIPESMRSSAVTLFRDSFRRL